MSSPAAAKMRPNAESAGQIAAGILIGIGLIALLTALPQLPWHVLDPLRRFVGRWPLLNALVNAAFIASFIVLHVLLLIWMERKIAGWIQARLGPMHVGWKGLAQTAADAMKLLLKEDIIPAKADRPLFIVGPFLAFLPTVLTFMVLPFSASWVGYDFSLGLLYVLAVSTTASSGILAAGWGANNKYALLGGVRAVAQLLSYEIPMVIVVLAMVALEGTMSLNQIVVQQQSNGWNLIAHWPIAIPGLLIYIVCALAELNRAPFDLPEAESELVSGFHTEYSGMRFAFFYLAEFANNFFSAGLAVVLFLGGWLGPVLPGPVWFGLKTLLVIAVMMWIRWTVPRLRIDQMMAFCWKVLVPVSLLLFCGAAIWAVR